MNATQTQIVETATLTGRYEINFAHAIIEHPKHGRLYLCEGYGGESTPSGGTYRWRHGIACKLQPGDTLQSLAEGRYNDHTSTRDAMAHGYDDSRPVMDWDGNAVSRLAESAGL